MTAKEKYRIFCQTEKALPIFSKDWYLDAVYGNQWDVAIVEQNVKIIAALPYCLQRKLFFNYIKSHPFTKMLGPYLSPKVRNTKRANKILTQLINQLPQVHFFQQNFHYEITDWLPLKWKGFQQTTRYSYIIDELDNLGKNWKKISSDYRNNKIKKAKAIVSIKSDLPIHKFYSIHKKSFERQNIPIFYSLNKLKSLHNALENNKAGKIFYAIDHSQNIHSIVYLIWDKETAYYYFAGDDPKFRNSGAGILLAWEAIRFTVESLKINRFDFEGSMLEPIEKVRRDFGAQQKPYFSVKKISSNQLSLLWFLREKMKSINY